MIPQYIETFLFLFSCLITFKSTWSYLLFSVPKYTKIPTAIVTNTINKPLARFSLYKFSIKICKTTANKITPTPVAILNEYV